MAEAATYTKPGEVLKKLADDHKATDERVKSLEEALAAKDKALEELGEKVKGLADRPNYGPAAVVGGFPADGGSYSLCRAARWANGYISEDQAKYELHVSKQLAEIYKEFGFKQTEQTGIYRRLMVPFATDLIPRETSEAERFVGELKYKMVAGAGKVDPDEVNWIRKRLGMPMIQKDLSTFNDAAGGVLVGFPTLGELIDIQRNQEAFANAGATEVALPPNGRLSYPKLTNTTTANWIGEGAANTESTPATGSLELTPKKLGIFTDINNELIRFGTINAEAMLRTDMAKVAALKIDLAELEGTGGTQILGLINYSPTATTWTTGQDRLLAYTVTSNTIQISDAADMEALLPDTAGEPTAWVMRRDLWAKIRNRRASAAITTDLQGPFLADITRSVSQRLPLEWDGTKVVRTSQVSKTRGNGSQTYAVLGNFKDWVKGRFGALEFLSSMVGDTQMTNDQTRIRCIQHVDAGARHPSSFVFADSINIS